MDIEKFNKDYERIIKKCEEIDKKFKKMDKGLEEIRVNLKKLDVDLKRYGGIKKMIKWRDFIRLNKCLNFPQGTLLVDAVKIMKIVLRSEEINAEHKKNE